MYPDECIFEDVFGMISNRVPKKTLMKASKIQFKECARCVVHNRACNFSIGEDDMCVLGTPCVLFSKLHDNKTVMF